MSVNLVFPSVKCVFVSYYLVVSSVNRCSCTGISGLGNIYNYNRPVRNAIFANSCSTNAPVIGRLPPPWKILFFGTDDFSTTSLKALVDVQTNTDQIKCIGAVTKDKSLVQKYSHRNRIKVYEWPVLNDVLQEYHIGIVVSYGKLIPERIIKALPYGVINVHASLLPRWRGASPIEYAVMNGDKETGVSIFRIKPHKFDVGDVIREAMCEIKPQETALELRGRLSHLGAGLLKEIVLELPQCLVHAVEQPEEGATYAPRISLETAKIHWKKYTAENVYNLYRGVGYMYPLITNWNDKPTRLYDIRMANATSNFEYDNKNLNADVINKCNSLHNSIGRHYKNMLNSYNTTEELDPQPGKILYSYWDRLVKAQCADGKWISCKRLRVGTGKIMAANDFYNGYLSKMDPSKWSFISE